MLTQQQQLIIDTERDFFMMACPGSGKTRSAAARVNALAQKENFSIAVCSYTNVGAERIATQLRLQHNVTMGARNFIGTIHAFLLTYVVYPYAHLLGAEQGPRVLEEGWPELVLFGDKRKRISVDCLRRNSAGGLVLSNKPRAVSETAEEILRDAGERAADIKRGYFNKRGLLSTDDAMWIALKILRDYKPICRALAHRFDEILLDEAQDTSELQLAAISEIKAAGLKSLVLVGDIEQSIYSFQGADPQGCIELVKRHNLREMSLDENHRSSQLVCDLSARFSLRPSADRAVGKNANCTIGPEVTLYMPAKLDALTGLYRSRLASHGIAYEGAATLARSLITVETLNGTKSLNDLGSRALKLAKISSSVQNGTLNRYEVAIAAQTIAKCAFGSWRLDDFDDETQARLKVHGAVLISRLPAPKGLATAWVAATALVLDSVVRTITSTPAATGRQIIPVNSKLSSTLMENLLSVPTNPTAQTIHSMKGEEREAIMMVIKSPRWPDVQLTIWENVLSNSAIDSDAEERRLLFVALSRSERYCLVALPNNSQGKKVAELCARSGLLLV